MAKTVKKPHKKKNKVVKERGKVFVLAGFNNIIVTITDLEGNTVCWGSGGSLGFKGSRKSTPYAANVVASTVGKKAYEMGLRVVSVIVKGPGSGRASAIKSLRASGLSVLSISDMTPIPHNGCRPRKRRRV